MVMNWDDVSLVRPLIVALIKALTASGLTKMQAYAVIAARVGKSEKWVRDIYGRNHKTKVSFSEIIGLKRLCYKLRVSTAELDAEADRIVRGDLRARCLAKLPRDPFAPPSAVQTDLFADDVPAEVKR